jgi:hypothetical protein
MSSLVLKYLSFTFYKFILSCPSFFSFHLFIFILYLFLVTFFFQNFIFILSLPPFIPPAFMFLSLFLFLSFLFFLFLYFSLPFLLSPKSCSACHLRDPKLRCPREALNMSNVPSYQPGDMNKMFSSIVERFGSVYDINVLSTDPWVVTFDNFLTDSEAKALISTVDTWERSTDTGTTNDFGETGNILLFQLITFHVFN